MDVTPLETTDRQAWETLYRLYGDFYEMSLTQDTLNTVWSWIFDPAMAFYCQVARDAEGNLIGLMHYRAMPSPLRGKFVGFLDDFYVLEAYRGQGVSDGLFRALDEQAQLHEWPFVRWITAQTNERAQGFYDRTSSRTQWLTYQLNAGDACTNN